MEGTFDTFKDGKRVVVKDSEELYELDRVSTKEKMLNSRSAE